MAFSFFTDSIDGYLARKYKTASVMGARLDSIADDVTIVVAVIGLFVFCYDFIRHEYALLILLLVLMTALVLLLPKWEADVRGIYWVLKGKRKEEH